MKSFRPKLRKNKFWIVFAVVVLIIFDASLLLISSSSKTPKIVQDKDNFRQVIENITKTIENEKEEVKQQVNEANHTPSPTNQQKVNPKIQNNDPKTEIKVAFYHTLVNYMNKANKHSWIRPISGNPIDEFNTTYFLAETLTTLIIMGDKNQAIKQLEEFATKIYPTFVTFDEKSPLREKYPKAQKNETTGLYTARTITNLYNGYSNTSFFLPSVMGAMLSAYSLTGEAQFFQTASNIISMIHQIKVDLFILDQITTNKGRFVLSSDPYIKIHKLGNYQTDFLYIAEKINKTYLYQTSVGIYNLFRKRTPLNGLFPDVFVAFNGEPQNTPTGYEYSLEYEGNSIYKGLIPIITLTHDSSKVAKSILSNFTQRIKDIFFTKDEFGGFVHRKYHGELENIMSMRTAYIPGLLAQASVELNDKSLLELADETLEAFLRMKKITPLPPMTVSRAENGDLKIEDPIFDFAPDLFESFYYMYNITKNDKYKSIAWELFIEFNKTCRTDFGYANINTQTGEKYDEMNPMLLSRTFKFLYLMFDDSALAGKHYTFNTHGNPMGRWNNPMNNFDDLVFDKIPPLYDSGVRLMQF